MSSSVEGWVAYQIANAPLRRYPYDHIYVEEVFEPVFYTRMRAMLPPDSAYREIQETGRVTKDLYRERYVIDLHEKDLAKLPPAQAVFWKTVADTLQCREVLDAVLYRFDAREWLGRPLSTTLSLMRDKSGYGIGPHTDAGNKIATLLFYLPADGENEHLGTSIYLPRDPSTRVKSNKHYDYKDFRRIYTAPFRPNTLFAFARSDRSFHGVEPIEAPGVTRDLLILNIKMPPQDMEKARGH